MYDAENQSAAHSRHAGESMIGRTSVFLIPAIAVAFILSTPARAASTRGEVRTEQALEAAKKQGPISLKSTPSSACQAFLRSSEKAAEQYELEQRFVRFESTAGAAQTSIHAVN